MRKNTVDGQRAPLPEQSLDEWMHAVALMIARRQMRGRWKSAGRALSTHAGLGAHA